MTQIGNDLACRTKMHVQALLNRPLILAEFTPIDGSIKP